MVDTILLEQKIAESGKTKTHLARACRITVQSLRRKILNLNDLTTSEVDTLCTELSITKLTEKEKIFFKK